MDTAQDILDELRLLGSASYKKVMLNHGAKEPFFGVKIADLQKIRKRLKKDYRLALDLYATGNYDAMYLAGLIADDARMTEQDLHRWAEGAYGGALPGATVPGVAAGNAKGWELALQWIDSPKENVACAGWGTLSAIVSVTPDDELDLPALKRLLQRVQKTIHAAPDLARYQMNAFLIAAGSFVKPLTALAVEIAEKIGPVTADLGNNSCETPYAPDYIRKVERKGNLGKKRKSAKC